MAHKRDILTPEPPRFRQMLINISHCLSTSELDILKFYCADFIPLAVRESIETGVQLWEAIMQKGRLSSSDAAFLQELMEKAIRRNDLLDIVVQYSNCVSVTPQSGNCL